MVGIGRRHWADDAWSYLADPRMPDLDHGWKLHVSARPADLAAVSERVVEVLERYACHAKFARDQRVLRDINSGTENPGAVGKAITIYPAPDQVRPLADSLVEALRGWVGPQIVSDRRVDADAPVYYRYGPFRPTYRASDRLELVMIGPDGESFPGLATAEYQCPPWARDPFVPQVVRESARPTPRLGGGRFEITSGISRSPQGNVYRATDLRSGRAVVVKQARAFVAEDRDGVDACARLRNERRVLTALESVAGVPEFVDYFRHSTDEYLVTSDCGPRNLRRDVLEGGARRSDTKLAARLLGILDEVHARGVIVRDLKPDNIVVGGADECCLVDFGVSFLNGSGPGGATLGYSLPEAFAGVKPDSADDLYALGMTLGFALTGLNPVVMGTDQAINRDRTLAGFSLAIPGPAHAAMCAVIALLLSFDSDERRAGAARIRIGLGRGAEEVRPRLKVTDDLLDEIIAHSVEFCVDKAFEAVARKSLPVRIDLYDGIAGLGLELLNHQHWPRVRSAVDGLVGLAIQTDHDLPPGLYTGRLGVDLFLAAARGPETLPESRIDRIDTSVADQITGVAGIGTGHLLLAQVAREADRQDVADRHLNIAAECSRLLMSGCVHLSENAETVTSNLVAAPEGFAHGLAGVGSFLLDYAHATGDPEALAAAQAECSSLASDIPRLIEAASGPTAVSRSASWCNGLAGIAMVLVRAAEYGQNHSYLDLAKQSARACLHLAPRMALVTQCCGLSGVGNLMVDLSAATGGDEFHAAAETVAEIILSRSGGPITRPCFPDNSLTGSGSGWATGTAGVLAFLRRLRG